MTRVLNIGEIDPSHIILANPCKAVSFARTMARMGVGMITFSNSDELHMIAHPRAKVIVRVPILTDDSKSTCAWVSSLAPSLLTVSGSLAKAWN